MKLQGADKMKLVTFICKGETRRQAWPPDKIYVSETETGVFVSDNSFGAHCIPIEESFEDVVSRINNALKSEK